MQNLSNSFPVGRKITNWQSVFGTWLFFHNPIEWQHFCWLLDACYIVGIQFIETTQMCCYSWLSAFRSRETSREKGQLTSTCGGFRGIAWRWIKEYFFTFLTRFFFFSFSQIIIDQDRETFIASNLWATRFYLSQVLKYTFPACSP